MSEVQDSLIAAAYQSDYLTELDTELAISEASFATTQERYALGAGDYLRVQTTQVALYQIAQRRLSAERQALSNHVQLCRAMGTTPPQGDEEL